MGNWNWPGIVLTVAVFFLLFGGILSLIHVDNPLAGHETSVLIWVRDLTEEAILPEGSFWERLVHWYDYSPPGWGN